MDINNPSGFDIPGDIPGAVPGGRKAASDVGLGKAAGRVQPGMPSPGGRLRLGLLFGIIIAIMLLLRLAGLYTDYLWFKSLGVHDVFLTALFTKLGIFIAAAAAAFLVLLLNVNIALKTEKKKKKQLHSFLSLRYTVIAVISVIFGLGFKEYWLVLLQYLNQVPFSLTDPIFSKDIAFFVFSLPFYELVLRFLLILTVIAFIASAAAYALSGSLFKNLRQDIMKGSLPVKTGMQVSRQAKYHLSALGAVFFLLMAANYYLNRYAVLYSKTGIVNGAGYTDIHILLPMLGFMIVISLIVSVVLFIWPSHFRRKGFLLGLIGVFIAVLILGLSIVPALVQSLLVNPNELEKEKPYIKRSIEHTRMAYGLDKVEEQTFSAEDTLRFDDLAEHPETIGNIRLWDPRPLKQTYQQLQEIRLYYDFLDVDVDRYTIDGLYTQLMLSPRELSQTQLADDARTWVNEHLVFTHGYGITSSPVNRFTDVGLPELLIKDIPPKADIEAFRIERPEIYYGEADNDFVIVKTAVDEFDFPKGDENQYVHYTGTGGVPVATLFRKLVMAMRFRDINILLTGAIGPDSLIMMNRRIQDRVRVLAPFILYDADPYIVLADNRLFWMLDGYTVTSRYPYSEGFEGINYIRNSVKIVIDAYHGGVTYYVIDHDDPLINTYRNIFPSLFRDFAEMPESLKSHVRYPEQLFKIQSLLYAEYHMKDSVVFYNKEDKWDIPSEVYGEGRQMLMEPYYIIMKLPGEEQAEFIIMTPFTPHKKKNMIGWLAARSDEDYGKLIVYKFPKDKLIYGPMQVEARIDQDPAISEQLTLWNQQGSSVIRGNLLVIPIEDSLLYIEPLYLLAQKTQLPELKRVIVYYDTRVVMEHDLETALRKVFGSVPAGAAAGTAPEEEDVIPDQGQLQAGIDELIAAAIAHYESVEESMQQGDWTGIGAGLGRLEKTLQELKRQYEV